MKFTNSNGNMGISVIIMGVNIKSFIKIYQRTLVGSTTLENSLRLLNVMSASMNQIKPNLE
jgi:hypothetical protein